MAEYGYMYQSYSGYSSVRHETTYGSATKPLSPFVPKTNGYSEGYVHKKTIVPVTSSKPYGDDYKSHEAYPSRDDDEWHGQTSPIRGSPRKVDEFHTKEATRPQRFGPMASNDWRQPIASNGANGYDDYGNNKERHKPTGLPISRDDKYDGYNGPSVYGGYNRKEGPKPTGLPIRNDNYDGYNDPNGYGGCNKKGEHKPSSLPIRHDKYDGFNDPNGYGGGYNKKGEHKPPGLPIKSDNYDDYNAPDGYGGYNKEKGYKPSNLPIRNDNYGGYNVPDGYGGYNKKEGPKSAGLPIRNDNYGGYNAPGSYGGYNKKEGHKPTDLPNRNDHYDGYNVPKNNGYGFDNGNNKEKHSPYGITNYDDDDDDYGNNNSKERYNKPNGSGWTRPKISPGWTASPRKGTQLSEPTHDIEKALELLKMEAEKHGHSNNNHDGSRLGEPTRKFDKGTELANETEKLKNIVTGKPQSKKSHVPIEPARSNKDDYGKTMDKRDGTRPYGNMNLSSPTRVKVIDGTRRYGNTQPELVMDSDEAEKIFNGTRVW